MAIPKGEMVLEVVNSVLTDNEHTLLPSAQVLGPCLSTRHNIVQDSSFVPSQGVLHVGYALPLLDLKVE